jgi:hypothetical protein
MAKLRQRRSAPFPFQVALEALKEQKTLSQLASEYERTRVHVAVFRAMMFARLAWQVQYVPRGVLLSSAVSQTNATACGSAITNATKEGRSRDTTWL